jgi:hypothetical protein
MSQILPEDRCQHSHNSAQCGRAKLEDSRYCEQHIRSGLSNLEAKKTRQYLLADVRYSSRLAALSEHDDVKSLREEIGFARMLIEKRFNMIQNEADLLSACGTLNTLLLTVERLVKSCNQVERNLGSMLSKPSVLTLGREIISIIVEELDGIDDYEDIIDKISERIVSVILEAGKDQINEK